LGEVQVRSASQLFLNDQRLLEQLEPTREELILHFQEVALPLVGLERLVEDHVRYVILHVLPASVAVADDTRQEPVVMTTVPGLRFVCCA